MSCELYMMITFFPKSLDQLLIDAFVRVMS